MDQRERSHQMIDPHALTENCQPSVIETLFKFFAIFLVIIFVPIALPFCLKVVEQYKRAVVMRFGRLRKDSPLGPGMVWILPCSDSVELFDLRMNSSELPAQEILTQDSVSVRVDAVIHHRVEQAVLCALNVRSHIKATELLSVATLRNIIGQYSLTDLLANRGNIGIAARDQIHEVTMEWGVAIERVEIKEIVLPEELQKALAAEAEGTRLGKAKIIEAEGEIKTAESLREASRLMLENPQTMLLRYLQTLNFIASDRRTTIVFPFPMELPQPSTRCSQSLHTNNMD